MFSSLDISLGDILLNHQLGNCHGETLGNTLEILKGKLADLQTSIAQNLEPDIKDRGAEGTYFVIRTSFVSKKLLKLRLIFLY